MNDSLTANKLAEYLKLHTTMNARIYPGRLPDMPNRVVSIVVGTGGGGLTMDGLFDTIGFTITCRGAENNFSDASNIAKEIDDILTGKYPDSKSVSFWLSDVYVDSIGRTGSGPVQLPMTDDQSRFMFTCNYYAQVATGIGQVSS